MAYAILPTAGVDWRSWDFVKQFYYAVRERYAAAGFLTWPRSAWIYESGIITAITATSVTIGGKVWATAPPRWVGFDNTTAGGWEAADYDLIIDDCDPRKVIRSPITAQPSADTLTIDDITQRVTERVTPSIAALVGRRGAIVKRGGIWWCDRWIEWPNDQLYADGIVKASAAGTLTSKRTLSPHILPGKEILFYNCTPALQRGVIATRVGNVLTYTGTTGVAAVDGYFAVVAAGGYCQLERSAGRPKSFYRGKHDAYYSHWPNDVLTATPKPAVTASFEYGTNPAACPGFPSAFLVLDVDLWVEQDNRCGPGDFTFSPDLYKTWRGLRDALFDICIQFVDRFAVLDHAASIPTLVAATWLSSAGINAQSSTAGTHTGTGLPVALGGLPYVPHDLWFAVLADDGEPQTFGLGTYDGTEISGSFSAADDGKTVIVSLGFTRWVPRQFRRMRAVTGLIPSVDVVPVWPPTELFPSSYQTLPASTHYLESDAIGVRVETTRAEDAFADGDLARYVGDNWDDPTTQDAVDGGMDDLTPYRDRMFTGRRTRAIQSRIDNSRSGKAVGGSTTQLTSAFDWWGVDFWVPGAVFVRTMTATGGSATTFTDTTQAGSAFWDDAARNQTGMVVTITRPSDASLHKRLITAHVGTTITFAPALPFAVAAGTTGTIRETDGVINRWKGRGVKLSKPDPVTIGATLTATTTISGNDDATIFFPAIAWAVDDTTKFTIDDESTGGVWLRAAGAWTVPTSNDLRAPNPPFQKSQPANAETMIKRYGLPNLRDHVVLSDFLELKSAISALKKTRIGVGVVCAADPLIPELSATGGSDSNQGSLGNDKLHAETGFASSAVYCGDPAAVGPPMTRAQLNYSESFNSASIARRSGYLTASISPEAYCPLTYTIEWYVYGWIDSLDHSPTNIDPAYTFDNNGDPISWHEWRLAFSGGIGTYESQISSKFGSLSLPNWGPDPTGLAFPVYVPPNETVNGYYLANQLAILDWAMVYD